MNDDVDRVVVDDLDAGDLVRLAVLEFVRADDVREVRRRQAALAAGAQQFLERVFHVLRGERAAAVELDAVTQMEAEARAGLSGSQLSASAGTLRPSSAVTVKPFVDVPKDASGDEFRERDRVHLRRIGDDVDPERLRGNVITDGLRRRQYQQYCDNADKENAH